MSGNFYFLILLINVLTKIITSVNSVKMNSVHIKLNESLMNNCNKIIYVRFLHHKYKNIYTYIRYPYLHINQRNINYLKTNNSIYSKYYNNEPVYNTYNPILNYDILDLIKVYGRLAEHGEYDSLNIVVNVGDSEGKEVETREEAKKVGEVETGVGVGEGVESTIDVKSTSEMRETKYCMNPFKKLISFFKSSSKHDNKRVNWFHHFLKYGKMNFTDFKNAILYLKFKWPRDSLFPSYNIFLFEKGLSKNSDSPLIRKKVEHYIQYQEINENLLKSCFYCFSDGKEYVTAYDILNKFIQWKKNNKWKKENEKRSFFLFIRKYNNTDDSIDWYTFKNKIDSYTVHLYESKK
ncbi:conserved Plasmodium protein, unknown function [Plasmodium malariae]|uniref:Plasmodium RESA N-terminal domain-containing protein n=2 Tax=Plasmodium malariae TaxID=5858 RepID=A0A1D3TC94_PLAMA|nr:conserved Plasmodium protein, unknown function [Plasmodium malariae]SCP02506.1 conserved Plasmodium protein, unknown function [Plasmodium malariae]